MLLPQHQRILAVIVYGYVAWQFLTVGTLAASAGLLLSLDSHYEAPVVLLPISVVLLRVALEAIDRLRDAMNGPTVRF